MGYARLGPYVATLGEVTAAGVSFADALLADPEVAGSMTREEIEQLIDPVTYTGLSSRVALETASRARAASSGGVL